MGWLKDMVKFENFQVKHLWERLKDEPERVLLHVSGLSFGDPLTTKVWEKILGKDYEPLFNQLGGPDPGTFAAAEEEGIDTSFSQGSHQVAYIIASYYAGPYVMNLFGGGGWGAGAATQTPTPAAGAATQTPTTTPGPVASGQAAGSTVTPAPAPVSPMRIDPLAPDPGMSPWVSGSGFETAAPTTPSAMLPIGGGGKVGPTGSGSGGGTTPISNEVPLNDGEGNGFFKNLFNRGGEGGEGEGFGQWMKDNPEITGSIISTVGQGLLSNTEGQRYEDMLRSRRQSHSGVEPGRNYRYLRGSDDPGASSNASSRYGGFEYKYDPNVRHIVKVERGAQEKRN